MLASSVTGALVMLAVSAWHLRRKSPVAAFRRTAIISLVVLLPAVLLNMFVGQRARGGRGQVPADEDRRGRGAVDHLPAHCSFSLFQIGGGKNDETPTADHLDSRPALDPRHQHVDGEVQGINELQAQYVKEYGPGNYIPNVFIQYWWMRVMAYLAP